MPDEIGGDAPPFKLPLLRRYQLVGGLSWTARNMTRRKAFVTTQE